MGNKAGSRRKSTSTSTTDGGPNSKTKDVKRRSKRSSSSGGANAVVDPENTREKKGISCPDLSAGAVPYKGDAGTVDVKIYRSFSNVADADKRSSLITEPNPDIKVYRRSTGNLRIATDGPDASQTLPRSFGRSRSSATGGGAAQPHGNGSLPRGERKRAEVDRRSTLSGGSSVSAAGQEARGTRRTISTASMPGSIGYKVSPEDFPDTSAINRKLRQFETNFVAGLTDHFCSGLSDTVQLSLISIAVRVRPHHRGADQPPVSLCQYLHSADVPIDLLRDDGDYVLTIPVELYEEVRSARGGKGAEEMAAVWTDISRKIITSLAREAASELSRIYEYQIALMSEGTTIELLGRHGARCVHEYLKKNNRLLDRNTIVQGAVRGRLRAPDICPKFSIVVGERELKWNLYEIFKGPGLRKEMYIYSGDGQMESEQPPWKFLTSSKHDPMLYGYRGLLVDWDFASSSYQLNAEDEASFTAEADWRPDDFHRDYCPYRRLAGLGVMREFCRRQAVSRAETTSFGEFLRQVQGNAYTRDRIQPVYRPLGEVDPRDQPTLETVNLGNTDLPRTTTRGNSTAGRPLPAPRTSSSSGGGGNQARTPEAVIAVTVARDTTATGSRGTLPEVARPTPAARNRKPDPSKVPSTEPAGNADDHHHYPVGNNVASVKESKSVNVREKVVPVACRVETNDLDVEDFMAPNGRSAESSPSRTNVVERAGTITAVQKTTSVRNDSLGGVDVDSVFLDSSQNSRRVATSRVASRKTITSDV